MLTDRDSAHRLLKELGAPDRLLAHVRLVGEAADSIIRAYTNLGLKFDAKLIVLGVAIHDVGKILHPQELFEPGSFHESAGKALLLSKGVQREVADCCVTHADWKGADVTLEERTVALADKLWKGKRVEELELSIIDGVASRLGCDRWEIFTQLDSVFEEIASDGPKRLHQSQVWGDLK